MKEQGRLAVLWHLHQPEYRDPDTGRPVMPWTRMHALRGYRDLFVETARRDVPVTINVVPVLLDQLRDYANGVTDDHLDLTRVPADSLTAEQIGRLRTEFVIGNEAMIRASPAYAALAERVRAGESLDAAGWRDVQVWSTLAWFGATAMADYPALAELRRRGRGFSEDDKRVMLGVQSDILQELPTWMRQAASGQRACVSVTPYHHPILPLLVDTRHARRCLPDAPTDVGFAWPEDARTHLETAAARYEEVFGHRPKGLWPSEGSVSPEVVELAGAAGYRWLATDEEVLSRSQADVGARPGGWDLGSGVVGFFRDRDLSDRIGFRYATVSAEDAARDFMGAAEARVGDGVLVVALDGENPWEAFADAGAAFRSRLYDALERGPVPGIGLDQAAQRATVGKVHHLHTGSWIGANFQIWFGDQEDHAAWRLLAETREAVERSPHRSEGLEKLYPAEGSDWFWWYGPEFDTPFAHVFDDLFRRHLAAAWRAIGEQPPEALSKPLKAPPAPRITSPDGLVAPAFTEVPSWRQWHGAGSVRWSFGSAMAQGARHSDGLSYGWDAEGALWLRLGLSSDAPREPGANWHVRVGDEEVTLPYAATGSRASAGGVEAMCGRDVLLVRSRVAAPVRFEVIADGGVRGAYPPHGALHLPEPALSAAMTWWSV